MVEKVVKVFTIIARIRALILVSGIILLAGCNDEVPQDQIPLTAFDDIFINLDLPEFNDLSFDNSFITLPQGVRGIILYRLNSTTFFAFERNCTFLPNEAGSTVNVDQSRLFMRDTSCGSTFGFDGGIPTSGPAQVPLRRYRVIQLGRTLTITDEIIN
ncbi:MAG: hypothetical protein AAFN93_01015 [Bacteroidota bacterium]